MKKKTTYTETIYAIALQAMFTTTRAMDPKTINIQSVSVEF